MPFANWDPEQSYESEPMIRYNVECKVFVKNRGQAGKSELNIVISLHKFWQHIRRPKVTSATANKPWDESETKIILSVTDRKPGKITKRFLKLNVNWQYVAKQLCG